MKLLQYACVVQGPAWVKVAGNEVQQVVIKVYMCNAEPIEGSWWWGSPAGTNESINVVLSPSKVAHDEADST